MNAEQVWKGHKYDTFFKQIKGQTQMKIYLEFIDLEKAFDNVPWQKNMRDTAIQRNK